MTDWRDIRLVQESDVPVNEHDFVCRGSRWGRLFAAVTFTALCAAAFVTAMELPAWSSEWAGIEGVFYPLGVFLLLPVYLSWRSFLAMTKPTNWVLRANLEGIYLRYRSPLNGDFPGEPVALFLPRGAIRYIAKSNIRWRQIDSDGDHSSMKIDCLDVHLRNCDLTFLRDALTLERNRRLPGFLGTRGVFRHYPVNVADDRIIRVEWSSQQFSTTPNLHDTVERLSRHYMVADMSPLMPVVRTAEEDLISLAESGQVVQAVKLAKDHYGLSTTEAKHFVDGLLH